VLFNDVVSIDGRMINEYGVVGGIRNDRGTRSTRRKLAKCHLTSLKGKTFATPDPKPKTNNGKKKSDSGTTVP
jgi:hypothetical protein